MLDEDASADQIWAALKARRAALLAAGSKTARAKALDAMVGFLGDVAASHGRLLHKWRAWGWVLLALYQVVESEMQDFLKLPGVQLDADAGAVVGAKRKRSGKSAGTAPRTDFWKQLLLQLEALHSEATPPTLHLDSNGRKLVEKLFGYAAAVISRVRSSDAAFERVAESIDALAWRTVSFIAQYRVYCSVLPHSILQTVLEFALSALDDGDGDAEGDGAAARNEIALRAHFVKLAIKNYPFELQDGLPVLVECLTGWFHLVRPENVVNTVWRVPSSVKGETLSRVASVVLGALTCLCKRYHSCIGPLLFRDRHLFDVLHFIQRTWKTYKFGSHGQQMEFILEFTELYQYNAGRGYKVQGVDRLSVCRELSMFARALLDSKDLVDLAMYRKPSMRGPSFGTWAASAAVLDLTMHTEDTVMLYVACAADVVYLHDRLVTEIVSRGGRTSQSFSGSSPCDEEAMEYGEALQITLLWEQIVENACRSSHIEGTVAVRGAVFSGEGASRETGANSRTPDLSTEEVKHLTVAWIMVLLSLLCRHGKFYISTRIADIMSILSDLSNCLVATEIQQLQYYALLTFVQVADLHSKNRKLCGDLLDAAWTSIWTNILRPELPYVRTTGETSLWQEHPGDAVLVLLNYFVASELIPVRLIEAHSATLWSLPALQPASARIPASALRRGGLSQVTGASMPAVMLLTALLNVLQLPEQVNATTTREMDSRNDSQSNTATIGDLSSRSAVPTRIELLNCVFENLRSYVCQDDLNGADPRSFDSDKDEYMPMAFVSVLGSLRRCGEAKNRSGERAFLPAFLRRLSSPQLMQTKAPAVELSGFGVAFSLCEDGLAYLMNPDMNADEFQPDSFSPMTKGTLATFSSSDNSSARAVRQWKTFERVCIPPILMRSVLPSSTAMSGQPIVDSPRIHAISLSDSIKTQLNSELANQFHITLQELSAKLSAAHSDPNQVARLLVNLQRVELILALLFIDVGEQSDGRTPPFQLTPLLQSSLELFAAYFTADFIARARLVRSAAPLITRILIKFNSFILALQSPDTLASCSHPSSVQFNVQILPELHLPVRQVVAAVEESMALATEAARSDKDAGDWRGPASIGFSQLPRPSAVVVSSIGTRVDPMDVETNASDKYELLLSDEVQMTINLWCFRVILLLKKEAGAEVVKRHVGDLQFSPDFLLAVAVITAGVPVVDNLDVFVRLVNHGISEAAGDSKKMQWHHSFSGALFVSQVLNALSLVGVAYEKRKATHHEEMPASLTKCAKQYLELSFSHPLRLHVAHLRAAEVKCLEVFFRLNSDAFLDFESAPLDGIVDASLLVRVESARALQTLLYMFPDGQSSICGEISSRLNGEKLSDARVKVRAQNKSADMCRTDSLCWYICAASFEDVVPDALFFYLRVAADERRTMSPSVVHSWAYALADAYDYPSVRSLVDDHFGFLWWSFVSGRRAMMERAAMKENEDAEPPSMKDLIEAFPIDVLLGPQQQLEYRGRLQLFIEKMDEIFPLAVLANSIDEPAHLARGRSFALVHEFAQMIGELRQTTSSVLLLSAVDDNIASDLLALSFVFQASGLKDLQSIADAQYELADKMGIGASLPISNYAQLAVKVASFVVLGMTDPRWIAWSQHHDSDGGMAGEGDDDSVFLEGAALWTQAMLRMKQIFTLFTWQEDDLAKVLTRFYVILLRSRYFGPRAERAVDCFLCFVREIQTQLAGSPVLQRLVLVICFQAIKQLTSWPRKRIARSLTSLIRELCELFMKTPDVFGKYFSLVVEEIGDILMCCGGSIGVSEVIRMELERHSALYLDEDNRGHLEWVVFAICNDMANLGKFASDVNAVPKGVSACLDKLNSLIHATRESTSGADSGAMKVAADMDGSSLSSTSFTVRSSEYVKKFIEAETKNEAKFYSPRRTLDSFGLSTLSLNSRGQTRGTSSSLQSSRSSQQRQAGAIVRLSTLSKCIQSLRHSGRQQGVNELMLTAGKLAHVLLHLSLTGLDHMEDERQDGVVAGIANALGDVGALDSYEFDLSPGVDVDELSRLFKRRFQRGALGEMVSAPLPVMHEQLLACLCSIVFERKVADAGIISKVLGTLQNVLRTEAGQLIAAQCKDKELKHFLKSLHDSTGMDWSSSLDEFLDCAVQDSSTRHASLSDVWTQGGALGFQTWICSVSASLADESPDPLLRACSSIVAVRADIAMFVFPFLVWAILSADQDFAKMPTEQQMLERKRQVRESVNEGIRWVLKQAGGASGLDDSWQPTDAQRSSCPPAEVVQVVIHTINFLREAEKAKFMLPRVKEVKGNSVGGSRRRQSYAYGCMVDVDLLDVARAAVSVKMPFSAMQYVEMWIEQTHGGMLPLSHPTLDGSAFGDNIRRILVDAYKYDSSIDGIYGVSDGRTFDSQLVTYSQENNYARTLPLYDVTLQFPDIHRVRAGGASAHATEGMLLSLQKLGYNHLLEGYMNAVLSLPTQRGSQALALIDDYKCERAWKNMQWSAVMTDNTLQDPHELGHQPVYSHHRMLFHSLKAMAHGDFGRLNEVTSVAKTRILQSLQVSLGGFEATQESYRALASLQSIREIEEVVEAMEGNQRSELNAGVDRDGPRTGFSSTLPSTNNASARVPDMEKFLESWQNRHAQVRKDFDTIENLLAVEEVLIKIADQSSSSASALSKLYLSLAARSRKADRVAVSYSALMRLAALEERHQLSVFDRLQWKMQRAKLLWSQHEGRSAIWTAKQVGAEISQFLSRSLTPAERIDLRLLHVGVLTVTGKWVAAQRSESSQVIIDEYLKRAVKIVESMDASEIAGRIGRVTKAHLVLADYMGEMYHQVHARVTSHEWIAGKKVAEARARELAACKAMRREHQDANRQHIMGLEREVAYDKEERASVENSVEQFLTGALANYGKSLAFSSKAELATVFKVLSLWFGNHSNATVDAAMKTLIGEVPSYKFVPLSYQIISRIGSGTGGSSTSQVTPGAYQDALSELVLKLCRQHPHHALVQLIALKNGGDVAGKNARAFRTNVGDAKSLKATEYLDMLRKTELGELLEAQDALANLYIQLALFDTTGYQNKGIRKIRLVDVPVLPTSGGRRSSRDRFPNFDQCFRDLSRRSGNRGFIPAVITLAIAPRADLDYSRIVRVHSFAPTFSITDTGIHRPKILYCCGSNGLSFKQLVKGLDDMRQDLVIEQVFDAVNQFLKENEETRRRNLRLVTYRVVPLSPAAGVLEWVDKTMPFGSYLTSRPSKRNGAHERYHPHEWRHSMCRQHLKTATTAAAKVQAYSEIEANFTPVFHHFFLEKFPDPATWYSRRLAYVRSVAVTSIVGYILGIGDRHAQNILIHEETAEFVHIDFGVVFDQGMALFTPETVPFRLTRDMVDGMGVSGCDGVFSRCCESTLQLLRAKSASVVTILEVFVHDPLYRWMLSPLKALRIQKDDAAAATGASEDAVASSSAADEEEEDASNDAAARALLRVKQKLEGFEDPNGNALSIEGQVKHLISEARNPRNLCRLFPGWAPWL